MKTWQKLALGTLVVVAIGGARVYFVNKARQDPGVIGKKTEKKLSQDDLAVITQYYFARGSRSGFAPATPCLTTLTRAARYSSPSRRAICPVPKSCRLQSW